MTEVELDSDTVRLSLDDDVVTVTLDAPVVRSALTVGVAAGMCEALNSLPDATCCVVVRGSDEAGAFCVGGDVNAMHELQADAMTLPRATDHVVRDIADCVHRVHECGLPTVAATDGPVMGMGVTLTIARGLRPFHDDTAVSFGFRRVGLTVDSEVSCLLPRLAGRNVTMELVYAGGELGPDRALELDIVNRVAGADEFEAELAALTERIADGPTEALTASKCLLRRSDDSIEAAIKHGASTQAVIFGTDDHTEGVASFTSRREPGFEGV